MGCNSIKKVDSYRSDVIDTCTKIRKCVFLQMTQHAFWTMFFGAFEIGLYILGHYYIQNLSSDPNLNPVLQCVGELKIDWKEIDTLGGVFMSLHSFLLTFSAATIVRTFYFIPKKSGLMVKFKFIEDGNETNADDSNRASLIG